MSRQQRPYVLVVDDDLGIRESLRFLFEEAEYEVEEAEDGEEALEVLHREARACVMLLDRMMARFDGAQTLLKLAKEPARVRQRTAVVFMSARSDPPDDQLAALLDRLARAVVNKPFDLDALLDIVARAERPLARYAAAQ